VGTAVVGGMIAATFFSVLFVPSFFVVFQWLGELGGKSRKAPAAEAPAQLAALSAEARAETAGADSPGEEEETTPAAREDSNSSDGPDKPEE
jgi:hypothetical protein